MSIPNPNTRLELTFTGRYADSHQIPAAVLMNALHGLQRTVHLLAMQREKVAVREKDRIDSKIERKYPIVVTAHRQGSFALEAVIGDPTLDLFASDDVAAVADQMRECLGAIVARSRERLNAVLPDRIRRERVLSAVRAMLPRRGSGVELAVKLDHSATAFSSRDIQEALPRIQATTREEEAFQTVTGKFTQIDFEARKLTIIYPPTNRELECVYEEAVEELLLEHPRDMIQVTGRVILGDDDHPKKIVEVRDIREVDLSPVELREFRVGDSVLRLRQIRLVEPTLDDSRQLLLLVEPDLGLDLHATTRDELLEILPDHFDVFWRHYALAPDDQLTVAARQLKARLLAAFEVIPDAISEAVHGKA